MNVKLVPITQHSKFPRLARKYAWDSRAKQFPTRLPNGRLNPLAGVTEHFVVSK